MKCKINGSTVKLIKKIPAGKDGFNKTVFEEKEITVRNVLVAQPSADDIVEATRLFGKKLTFVLGIPKGDQNDWEDTEVVIFGKRYKTFGFVEEGIESNIHPAIPWHKKVKVERYG